MKNMRARLERKRAQGSYRTRTVSAEMAKVRRVVDGREVLSFCSNDYLGLAAHECVVKALRDGAEKYGVGSGASALVNGYTSAHRALEERLAEFTGRERALLFSSGYMANLGVVRALTAGDQSSETSVFGDRLNHASLTDAALLSRARFKRYAHLDVRALERLLKAERRRRRLVVTDAVFSMDGDVAPLARLAKICTGHEACLCVDDAHGFGVLGARGAGTLEHQGLSQPTVPVLIAAFGKACGTAGAFVAGSEELIEWLIQEARTYIYTTAMPPAIACATLASLRLIEDEGWRREKLRDNVVLFRRSAQLAGLNCTRSDTAIQPLVVGAATDALAVSEALFEQGLQVVAIRPPTVPQGSARLRITLSAAHEAADIERLVGALAAHPVLKRSADLRSASATCRTAIPLRAQK